MGEKMQANEATIADLKDIHRGLHVAMDAAIRDKKHDVAEITLRQLDTRLTNLINTLEGANPGTWF